MSMRDLIAGVPNNLAEDRVPEAGNCDMYVVTNRENVNGAAVFLYDSLLFGFADKDYKEIPVVHLQIVRDSRVPYGEMKLDSPQKAAGAHMPQPEMVAGTLSFLGARQFIRLFTEQGIDNVCILSAYIL